MLDVRDSADFALSRMADSVNVSPAELKERLFELPPKGPLRVVVSNPTTEAQSDAIRLLSDSGWTCTAVTWDATNESVVRGLSLPGRLWSPSPFLEAMIAGVEAHAAGRVAVDVGCGSGRDAAFLSARGWSVLGFENRHKLAMQARGIAERHRHKSGYHDVLEAQLDTVLPLRPHSIDLIVCVRFLHRPLLARLTQALRPGGCVVYSHFVDGVQHVGTPKNPAGYLLHDELLKVLGPDGCGLTVVHHEETTLDDGRPIVNFCGRLC